LKTDDKDDDNAGDSIQGKVTFTEQPKVTFTGQPSPGGLVQTLGIKEKIENKVQKIENKVHKVTDKIEVTKDFIYYEGEAS